MLILRIVVVVVTLNPKPLNPKLFLDTVKTFMLILRIVVVVVTLNPKPLNPKFFWTQ